MKILQIAPFPSRNPLYGGQIRVFELAEAWRRAGATVIPAAFHAGGGPRRQLHPEDVAIPRDAIAAQKLPGEVTDLALGEAMLAEPALLHRLQALIERIRPDLIQLEHPFQYPAVAKALAAARLSIPLLHSSHNLEHEMKARLLQDRVPAAEQSRIAARIRQIEAEVSAAATLTLAVTESDAAALQGLGARRVAVLPNASRAASPSPRDAAAMAEILGEAPYALFVGSGHPPNITGFWSIFDRSLAFLPRPYRIVAIGSVCHGLLGHPLYKDFVGINRRRLVPLFEQPSGRLAAALAGAQVVILPITTGGGSNLKTAEALLTGARIVATPKAFHGYEAWSAAPGVTLAPTPQAFRSALLEALAAPRLTLPEAERQARAVLSWDHALAPLPRLVRAALAEASAAVPAS